MYILKFEKYDLSIVCSIVSISFIQMQLNSITFQMEIYEKREINSG